MTAGQIGDALAVAIEGWLGKVIAMVLVPIAGMYGWSILQTVEQTQKAVTANGIAEARLEGKFDTLTNAVTAFQAQTTMQRSIDEAQTTALGVIRTDVVRLTQIVEDHLVIDKSVHRRQGVQLEVPQVPEGEK